MEEILIIGCGDIGRRVARLALARGAKVSALVRSPEKAVALEESGIRALVANLDDPETLIDLPAKGAVVFYFAPPPGGGIHDTRARHFCAAFVPGAEPAKLVYLSTSGVYGPSGDALVTEDTPPDPQTARGKRRLDAETVFTDWCRERRVDIVILRVTGIYGPGRLPVAQLTSGQPVLDEREASFTNRIHADDLATVCLAAADRGENGDIFNVSDGHPGTMTEYFNAAADILGLPRPPQVSRAEAQAVMTPLMLSYIQESRRLDNRRMLDKLGVRLRYPDLCAGIASCRERE
ncbi:MAG TPA: SDR family oxidoreductase [Geobacteraceae bacterium]